MSFARSTLSLTAALALFAPDAFAWSYAGTLSVSSPCPSDRTPLRVEREEVELDCRDTRDDALRCVATARVYVVNPTDGPVTVTLRAAGTSDETMLGALARSSRSAPHEVTLTLAPGETRRFLQRFRHESEAESPSWRTPMIDGTMLGMLHPVLAGRTGDDGVRMSVSYTRAGACTSDGQPSWSSVGATTMVTRAPRGWRPTIGWEQRGLCRSTGAGLACTQVEEVENYHGVSMSFEHPANGVARSGGPVVGLGGTVGRGFRARLGYEFALVDRVLVGVSGDIAAPFELAFAPSVGVMFRAWRVSFSRRPWLPFAVIPSVGAPVRVLPEQRVGARAGLALAWMFAGLEVSADWWPADERVDVSIFLRAGL